MITQNRTEHVQNRTEQSRAKQNRAEQNRTDQSRTEQSRSEQNRIEQNRREQNRTCTEQNGTEQNIIERRSGFGIQPVCLGFVFDIGACSGRSRIERVLPMIGASPLTSFSLGSISLGIPSTSILGVKIPTYVYFEFE